MFIYYFILFLVMCDFFFTWIGISFDYLAEMNFILIPLFNLSFMQGFLIKFILTSFFLLIIYKYKDRVKFINIGISVLVIAYAVVNLYHIYLIIFYRGVT